MTTDYKTIRGLQHPAIDDLAWRLQEGKRNATALAEQAAEAPEPTLAQVLDPVHQVRETLRVDRHRRAEPLLTDLATVDARLADLHDQTGRLDERVRQIGEATRVSTAPRPRRRGAVALSAAMFALASVVAWWANPVDLPSWLGATVALLALATICGAFIGTTVARTSQRRVLTLSLGGAALITAAAILSDRLGFGVRDQILLDAILGVLVAAGSATVWGQQRSGMPLRELDQIRRERAARRNETEELRLRRAELVERLRRLTDEFDAHIDQLRAILVHATFDFVTAFAEREGDAAEACRAALAKELPEADELMLPRLVPECHDSDLAAQEEDPESTST